MKARWLIALTASLISQSPLTLAAFQQFTINDIRIEGLKRITEGTVYNYLPVHVGEEISESQTHEILKALFDTGFFQDIQLARDGNVLVVKIIERPTIGTIVITGNNDIKSEQLLTSLKEEGLYEGHVFNRSTLELVRNQLERVYYAAGKYSIKVEAKVIEKENNRVDIEIAVDEGVGARIKNIDFTGNIAFSSEQLSKSFILSSTNNFSWISRADQYDKQKLSADLETLRTYYLDRGYLNFQINSTQVSISPDKRDIYVHINLTEGKPFKLSAYKLAGDFYVPAKELLDLIELETNVTFSRTKVANTVKTIQEKLGEFGYAFAKVNPVPELDEANYTVQLTFYIEPGNLTSVRKVLFEGNTKSRDEVLRREIIQMESAPVNTKMIEESRTRLNRTGYFSEVKAETRPVAGTSDLVDVVYIVQESSAGQLGGGLGYSSADGLIFNASASNRNFLGTGNGVDFNFNYSKTYTTYNLNYNNPYYTLDGVSRGFGLFYSKTELSESTNVTNYTTDAYGLNVNYGMPISPVDRISYGYGFQSTKLFVGFTEPPTEVSMFVNSYGQKSDELTAAIGWGHYALDRYLFPQNGFQQSVNLSTTVPGSDLLYYRITYNMQFYRSLAKGFIFHSSGLMGYGDGYGSTKALPFYRNFFAGGSRTVRGYDESSLGPVDSTGKPFGGNAMFSATAGLILPNFFDIDPKAVRSMIFFDAGQVYDLKYKKRFDNAAIDRNLNDRVRLSVGAAVTWMTPMAPLVFSYSYPINPHEYDKVRTFSFTFGTVF